MKNKYQDCELVSTSLKKISSLIYHPPANLLPKNMNLLKTLNNFKQKSGLTLATMQGAVYSKRGKW